MWQARLRLASLWLSATTRVVADWGLRFAIMAEIGRDRGGDLLSGWHQATVFAISPFVLLAPLNGILSNGLPRRWVLATSALFIALVVTGLALIGASPSTTLFLASLGAAVYSPARFAMIPAAAADARLSLPRVNGWFEMGTAASILGGMACCLLWSEDNSLLLGSRLILGLAVVNLICVATALPARFAADVIRPEPPGAAVRGFFGDMGRVWSDRRARGGLLGLACLQALVTAGSGVLVEHFFHRSGNGASNALHALLAVGAGAALGSGLASLSANPRRNAGLIPFGATGLPVMLAWASLALVSDSTPALALAMLLGCTVGLTNAPLRSAYMAAVPADARGNAMAVMNTAIYVVTVCLALLLLALSGVLAGPIAQLGLLAALAAIGAAVAWRYLYANAVEQLVEMALSPGYRFRLYGPGRDSIPQRGPLLIVGNHTSYLDPFWVAKIVPRHLTPMMTSAFYDLPIIHWLMRHIVGAIRVEQSPYRREAPELQQAIERLKTGGCVLVFPEAVLRRHEEQLLRPFGQGVWHILREVPDTPVLVLWIEGGWGSFMSYRGGPPTKNKWPDFLRLIRIAVGEAKPLDPAVLADHRTTREYLHRACLTCREYLGLPPAASPASEKPAEAPPSAP